MRANPNRHAGFTLIELMIAVTLGLLVLAALTSFFVRTSYNRSELERNSQQIENGRFAINALRDDMMLAGFYADLNAPPTAVWNTPAACATSGNMGFVPHDPTTSPPPELPVPIFIYPLGAGAPAGCTPNILANTDVIVIRRFNTEQWKTMFMAAYAEERGLEIKHLPALNRAGMIPCGRSSSDLSVSEMSELMEWIAAWGAENGIKFHDQEELEYA